MPRDESGATTTARMRMRSRVSGRTWRCSQTKVLGEISRSARAQRLPECGQRGAAIAGKVVYRQGGLAAAPGVHADCRGDFEPVFGGVFDVSLAGGDDAVH